LREETQAGAVVGTPSYLPPEQARGETARVDERSDVFGLGAILCEILIGAPPFRGGNAMDLLAQSARGDLSDAFARLETCRAEDDLVRLAKRCLSATQELRPRNGVEVAEAVAGYLNGVQERLRQAELAHAQAQARAEEERKRRRVTLALAAAVVAILALGGGGWLWLTQERAARAEKQAQLTRQAQEELRNAVELRNEARAAPADDLSKWNAAFAALKRTEGLLAGDEADPELRQRTQTLLQEMEAESKDRRLLARLEEARMQAAVTAPEGSFDFAGSAALYAKAFADEGWDLTRMDPKNSPPS
jgi:serine/threonine-protein kinase